MFKKIFVGLLLTILVAAAATGLYQYTQTASAQAGTTQPETGTTANLAAQSSGQGYRGGQASTAEDLDWAERNSTPSTIPGTFAGIRNSHRR